jgi:sialate O-acetylesterase
MHSQALVAQDTPGRMQQAKPFADLDRSGIGAPIGDRLLAMQILAKYLWKLSIVLAIAGHGSSLLSAQPANSFGLPHVFGDHMVLQTGQRVPIWGWAAPGEQVTVAFAGQTKSTVAAVSDGAWKIYLDPLAVSSEPRDLTVTGTDSVTLHDVLVGEVWLCSGQSNMQKPLGTWRGQPIPTVNSEQEIAAADYPLIRMMNIKIAEPEKPAQDVDTTQHPMQDYPWAGWVPTTPVSIDRIKFSAACYFFGRKLYQSLKVPIGLIEATAGGTHIEAWTPPSGFAADPALADFTKAAQTPRVEYQGTRISTLYNGMIHPIAPYALRGVLWYQGESNVYNQDGGIYTNKMVALINSWRAEWGRDFSFYYVQLPPLLYSVTRSQYVKSPDVEPIFWEAQTAALRMPHTGMIVTTDVGEPNNMHPPHKKEVGERLALWALAEDYGRKDVEPSGPLFRSMKIKHGHAILEFDHVGGGLIANDNQPLNSFIIAGADGKFIPATAVIKGTTVIVSSPQIAKPTAVRFAWSEAASPNFFNKNGLPASPFRTDNPFTHTSNSMTKGQPDR